MCKGVTLRYHVYLYVISYFSTFHFEVQYVQYVQCPRVPGFGGLGLGSWIPRSGVPGLGNLGPTVMDPGSSL